MPCYVSLHQILDRSFGLAFPIGNNAEGYSAGGRKYSVRPKGVDLTESLGNANHSYKRTKLESIKKIEFKNSVIKFIKPFPVMKKAAEDKYMNFIEDWR